MERNKLDSEQSEAKQRAPFQQVLPSPRFTDKRVKCVKRWGMQKAKNNIFVKCYEKHQSHDKHQRCANIWENL